MKNEIKVFRDYWDVGDTKRIRIEYFFDKNGATGIHRQWFSSGRVSFMFQNKKGDKHGVTIRFEY